MTGPHILGVVLAGKNVILIGFDQEGRVTSIFLMYGHVRHIPIKLNLTLLQPVLHLGFLCLIHLNIHYVSIYLMLSDLNQGRDF